MMIDYLEYPSCCCFSLWVCALCNVIIRCQFYFIFSAIIGYLTMCSTETISFHYCSPLAVTTFLDLDFWIWMKSSIVAEPFSVKMNMLKAAGEVGTNWMTYVVILWQGIRYLRTVVRVGYWRFTKVKRIHWHTTHVMKLLKQAMRMLERVTEEGQNWQHPVQTYGRKGHDRYSLSMTKEIPSKEERFVGGLCGYMDIACEKCL